MARDRTEVGGLHPPYVFTRERSSLLLPQQGEEGRLIAHLHP